MFPVTKIGESSSTTTKQGIDTSDERKAFDSFDDKKVPEKKEEKKDDDDTTDTGDDESGNKSKKTDDEETIEEQDEDDDEQQEETEDEDEVAEDDTVFQALKKTDKDIFKKIPELRHILFREQKYTEYFPTVDDAKDAREQVETFNQYQSDLMEGSSEKLLEALEKTDKKVFENFVGNFIPTLQKQSNDLYLQMIFPEIKKLCRAAAKSGDENVKNSAMHIHNYVFGNINLDENVGIKPKEKSEAEDNLTKREREFNDRQLKSFSQDVFTVGTGRLEREIGKAFRDSDISPLLQKSLTNEIKARVDDAMQKDPRHMGNMNHLWERAKREGFTSESKDRIINTYLSRAKLLIASKRQAVLSEAKLSAKGIKEEKKQVTRIPASGSSSTMPKGKIDSKKIDWSKAGSEREMLEGNIPLRK